MVSGSKNNTKNKSSNKMKKRVCFNECVAVFHMDNNNDIFDSSSISNPENDQVELEKQQQLLQVSLQEQQQQNLLFWSKAETAAIQKSSKEISLLIRRHSKELGHCHIKEAYNKVCTGEGEIDKSSTTPYNDLVMWCQYKDDRRGLEKFASKEYSISRRRDIKNHRSAVLLEQQRLKENTSNSKDNNKGDQTMEILAKISEESSRRSVRFATLFGEVDAFVAPFSSSLKSESALDTDVDVPTDDQNKNNTDKDEKEQKRQLEPETTTEESKKMDHRPIKRTTSRPKCLRIFKELSFSSGKEISIFNVLA